MPLTATVDLKGLDLDLDLGTYGPGDIVPKHHRLDMTLGINADRVLIAGDSMDRVFDYDPLIAAIRQIAGAQHYETQEYLITLIAQACAAETAIIAANIFLYKAPVDGRSGELGVRLVLGSEDMERLRTQPVIS